MKKLLITLLSVFMIFTLVGCQGGSKEDAKYTNTYSTDISTLNYVLTDENPNQIHLSNFVDPLYENDRYGNFIPALAESHEVNEDATVWTFKIRQGVKWVTSSGEEYAEVTAHDWVTAMKYLAEKQSPLLWLGTEAANIKNLADFSKGTVGFEEVGVKALDDYTLEYTLSKSTPYFLTMTSYAIFLPVNEEFLNSKGDKFGTTDPDSILYNGGFLLTVNDAKSKISYVKNPTYWDMDNVHIKEVELFYDDGADVYSQINGFEQGIYVSSALNPNWDNFDEYKEKYADYISVTLPNSSSFGVLWNYNRRTFEHTNKDEAQRVNAQNAIKNVNFRKAFQAAYDTLNYLRQSMPEDVALTTMRNMLNVPDLVSLSDGTLYHKVVEKYFAEVAGQEINLADGQNPFFGKEAALAYIEKAKADGIEFPVHIDLLYIGTGSEVYQKRANSLKQSIESNTDGQIILDIHSESLETVLDICFYSDHAAAKDYDINTFAGWGPDFVDPKTSLDVFHSEYGAFMKNSGLDLKGKDAENDQILTEVGFDEYTRLLEIASEEVTDMDKRYDLYAQAEAYLLGNALYMPTSQQMRGYLVTKVVPFTAPFAYTGLSTQKLKFVELQDEMVTTEQYEKAKADWEAVRESSK